MFKIELYTNETVALQSKKDLIGYLSSLGLAPWYINARLVYLARTGLTFIEEGKIFAL